MARFAARFIRGALVLALVAWSAARSPVQAQGNNIAFPHVGVYGGVSSAGRPITNLDGSLNSAVLDAYSRFQLAILNATPLGDVRKDIVSALRARNPNLKIFAYSMPGVMWCGNQYDSTTYYRHLWDLVKSYSGIAPPYSDCDFTGSGFVHLQSGQTAYDANVPNINLAKRVLVGSSYTYPVAEAVADLVYTDIYGAKDGSNNRVFDGLFFDVYCDDLSWMETPSVKFDYAAAGYGSDNSDPANRTAFMQGWTAGFIAFADRLRSRVGDNKYPLVGNCGPGGRLATQFNGWMAENFPFQNGGTWFTNMYRETGGYFINDTKFRDPSYNFLFSAASNGNLPYSSTNRQKARFGLGSASLSGGFSHLGDGSANALLFDFYNWYYDEYSVNTLTGITDLTGQHLGWLGAPKGDQWQMISADSSSLAGDGNFESGNGGWGFHSFAPSSGSLTIEQQNPAQGASSAHAHLATIGPARWYTNLYQTSSFFMINAYQPYAITFWAKGDQARSIDVVLSDNFGAVYGGLTLPISSSWKRYQVVFYPSSSGANGQFRFDLGSAVGDVWFDEIRVQNQVTNVYRRDFTNGIILVNPFNSSQTVALEKSYRKIAGSVAPDVNDGSVVSSVTIAPSDALFLLNYIAPAGDHLAPAVVGGAAVNRTH